MGLSRDFTVTRDVTIYRTETYYVTADSFEEAETMVEDGYVECDDYYDYDYDGGSIDSIVCDGCGYDEERDCECRDEEAIESSRLFFADMGM